MRASVIYAVAVFLAAVSTSAAPGVERRATECYEDCVTRCNAKTSASEIASCLTGCASKSPCTTAASSTTTSTKSSTTTASSAAATTATTSAASSTLSASAASSSGVLGFATLGSGCTGGAGGSTVTVSNAADLQAALLDDTPRIVYLNAAIASAGNITVGSNKSLIGVGTSATLDKSSLSIRYGVKNIIIRNIKMTYCTGGDNDCITIKDAGTSNIWIDHCDLSGDLEADKDTYDGLIDITREATYITVSYTKFWNHHKVLLIGSSGSAVEDAIIKVTLHHNYFYNVGSRTPSIRYATVHIANNYYDLVESCIYTRATAQALIVGNVFRNINKDVRTDGEGFCNLVDNDLGIGTTDCPTGTFTSTPYAYTADSAASVLANLISQVGVGKI